uniref:Dentin sialophosphoprotein n=1 Tax=Phallusia mammillata TaxID=59560 RepID=A0A6F9DAP4_9ASCI|nr:dentin sialophosphoprotein [Phallusia mammillata]
MPVPTSQRSRSFIEQLDTTLAEKIKKGEVKRKLMKKIDAIDIMEHMDCFSGRTKQEIEQTQNRVGQERAAAKFVEEVKRFDSWSVQFLDALYFSGHEDLAKEIYHDYIPPESLQELPPRDLQPADSPPPYALDDPLKTHQTVPKTNGSVQVYRSIQDQQNAFQKVQSPTAAHNEITQESNASGMEQSENIHLQLPLKDMKHKMEKLSINASIPFSTAQFSNEVSQRESSLYKTDDVKISTESHPDSQQ